jgi:hypothetical protein
MGSSLCPKCGTPRVGAFRFCRSCTLDFDDIDRAAGATPAPQAPESGSPATRQSYSEKYARTQWAATPAIPSASAGQGRWPRSRGAGSFVLGGLVLWVVAQALPAYTGPGIGEPTITRLGLYCTLFTWLNALFIWNHTGALPILVAWAANIWLVLAIASLGLRRNGAALRLATLAAASSAVGMWVLLSGGLPDVGSYATVTEIGIGSFVWFASTLVVLAAIAYWPLPTRSSATEPG